MRPTIIPTDQFYDEPGPDIEGPLRTIWQGMRLWVLPEIEKRRQGGEWPEGTQLVAAQVLFIKNKIEVRLNQQVRGLLLAVPTNKDALGKMSIGDALSSGDLQSIQNFDLQDDDRNYGHVTFLSFEGQVYLFFNAKQNRAEAVALLTKADEFLEAARDSIERHHAASSNENLFAAAELTAKAHLIALNVDPDKTSHKVIHSEIHREGHRGNTDSSFVKLFGALSNRRKPARYMTTRVDLPSEDDCEVVARQIADIRQRYIRW